MKKLLLIAVLVALATVPAMADTSSGTMTVTATVQSSINLTFVSDGGGISLTGSGSNAATMAFSNVQAYGGSVPAGVSKSVNGTTDWSLSTSFSVRVENANLPGSTDYLLQATLSAADSDLTWEVNSVDISDGTQKTIDANAAYDTNNSYSFVLTIPHSFAAASVNKSIAFLATSN